MFSHKTPNEVVSGIHFIGLGLVTSHSKTLKLWLRNRQMTSLPKKESADIKSEKTSKGHSGFFGLTSSFKRYSTA